MGGSNWLLAKQLLETTVSNHIIHYYILSTTSERLHYINLEYEQCLWLQVHRTAFMCSECGQGVFIEPQVSVV